MKKEKTRKRAKGRRMVVVDGDEPLCPWPLTRARARPYSDFCDYAMPGWTDKAREALVNPIPIRNTGRHPTPSQAIPDVHIRPSISWR